jgi:hypothetical protein
VKKTLTISGHRRPDYFQRVLSALAFCEGVSEYAVTAVLDPSEWTDQLAEIARGHGITVHIPAQHLGCGAAIRYCMELGFKASDYHIHLEDDTVPSPDALRWFEWAGRHASPMTLTVSGYNQHGGEAEPNMAYFRHWFTPWGWATWRSHWEKYLLPGWDTSFWDGGVQRIRDNLGMGEMFPRVSRIQNIGATRGAFCPSEYFHRENHHANRVATPEDKTERWILA